MERPRSSARSSSGAVEMRLRIWLRAWVRLPLAERRATRNTRMASTFPSLVLADPVASPPWAARAAQGGDATGSAKTRDGNVEAMRVLRVARRSARGNRTQALNQMRSLISTAPEELRAELRGLSIYKVLTVASAYRHTGRTDVTTVTKLTLRTLARRALSLEEEVTVSYTH